LSVAADVTLAWNSNVETDIAGYQISYGFAPGQYGGMVDAGNRTSYRFTDLQSGATYYFAVRAYNTNGLYSPFSPEVSAAIPAATPLQLTSIATNYTSPKPVGTQIAFAAAATGGAAPYQYKWFISLGSTTYVQQAWSTNNTLVWTPLKAGFYTITVWARNAKSTRDAPENSTSVLSTTFDVRAER
jgi:chitodextrinase